MTTAETTALLHHWREAVPDDRLAHLVRDAARAFGRALTTRLAQEGVSFGHWVFLRILWSEDGLTQRELAARAGLTEPTAFTALKEMERLQLVHRARRPESRRKIFVELTQAGRGLEARLVPLAEDVNTIAAAGSGLAELIVLRQVLLRMLENLARDEEGTDRA